MKHLLLILGLFLLPSAGAEALTVDEIQAALSDNQTVLLFGKSGSTLLPTLSTAEEELSFARSFSPVSGRVEDVLGSLSIEQFKLMESLKAEGAKPLLLSAGRAVIFPQARDWADIVNSDVLFGAPLGAFEPEYGALSSASQEASALIAQQAVRINQLENHLRSLTSISREEICSP